MNKKGYDSDILVGIRNGITYYFVGAIITKLVHYVVEWEYPHAPPASFFVFLLILVGGIIRAIWNLINIKNKKEAKSNKYELIIHFSPALVGISLILMTLFMK